MPKDKLDWQVLDTGRTTIDLLGECAGAPRWLAEILTERPSVEEVRKALIRCEEAWQTWTTIEQCQANCDANSEFFYDVVRQIPDEELTNKVAFPWDQVSVADTIMLHYKNVIYHLGQINFIQTLYGDMADHS